MRLRKGCKVEVLSKKEVVTGAWLCAEIISGNGHTYSVKYDWFSVTGDAVVERVPRKALRPCPPPVDGTDNWIPGDLVEVFHNISWKTATITKVIGGNSYLVRLLGTSQEFRVDGSHLRVRLSWEDGKWFVVGKGSGNCMTSTIKKQTRIKMMPNVGDYCFPVERTIEIPEPQIVSTGTLKRRSPLDSAHVDAYSVAVQKKRAVEKNGHSHRMFSRHPSPFPEKVDAFVSPQKILGEKYMHASFDTRTTRFNDSFVAETLIATHTDSSVSSVASCSVTDNDLCYLSPHCTTNHSKAIESDCSDAESFCGREYEDEGCSHPTNGKLVPEVQRSELHARCCSTEALYASGPLGWKEEEKATNLHHALHISNDGHLMVIQNLIAADSRLTIS